MSSFMNDPRYTKVALLHEEALAVVGELLAENEQLKAQIARLSLDPLEAPLEPDLPERPEDDV